jgi:hypothetical protein
MLTVTYPECRYAECHYAECRYAECRYAECRGASKSAECLERVCTIKLFTTVISFLPW